MSAQNSLLKAPCGLSDQADNYANIFTFPSELFENSLEICITWPFFANYLSPVNFLLA